MLLGHISEVESLLLTHRRVNTVSIQLEQPFADFGKDILPKISLPFKCNLSACRMPSSTPHSSGMSEEMGTGSLPATSGTDVPF